MSLVEFKAPDFVQSASARAIEKKMMAALPKDIDKTEGGFAWDLTYPTALEKSELLQYHLVLALKMMFPMWATGEWLDYHAHDCGLERRAATYAYGHVTVTGQPGLVIPEGFVFSVPADSGVSAIDFASLEEAVIPAEKQITIAVQAVASGTGSNVDQDTVTIMRSPMQGVYSITNEEPITGGVEQESDDSLRKRIDDLLSGKGDSFVGNNKDYVRWAEEVPGVGYAYTIPEYNGPNSVKVVVVDGNGIPANEQICEAVRLHIFGEDRKDINRLAPIGVMDFVVVAPAPITVDYSFELKLTEDAVLEVVQEAYKTALKAYYVDLANSGRGTKEVRYARAMALLDAIPGVADFKNFLMNGGTKNVVFEEDEYPVTGDLEVSVYEQILY